MLAQRARLSRQPGGQTGLLPQDELAAEIPAELPGQRAVARPVCIARVVGPGVAGDPEDPAAKTARPGPRASGTLSHAAAVTVAAIGGATITAASAHVSTPASRHGREHLTLMASLARTADANIHATIIGTGLFTDGGTIDITKLGNSATAKLGRGTIRLTTTIGSSIKQVTSTCLTTQTASGTYKLSHGTGKYARISGSGHFKTTVHFVSARNRNGSCSPNRERAFQAVATLSGTATLPR